LASLRRIAGLSGAFLGSDLIRAAIAFGMSVVLGRGLGVDRFGRWVFCTTWASTLTAIADLGFGVLLTRDGARGDADPGLLLGAALLIRLTFVVPAAIIVYLMSTALAVDVESVAGLRVGVLLAIAGAGYGCFAALLRAVPRWLPSVLALETGCLAAQFLAAWWIVRHGGGVVPLLTLMTVVQLAQIAAAAALWPSALGVRTRLRIPSPRATAAILKRALPFAASGAVANLQTRAAPLMLGYLSTRSELGWFAVASRFGSLGKLVPHAMFSAALPLLSNQVGRNRPNSQDGLQHFERMLLAMAVAVAAPCIALAAPLLTALYGASFAAAAPTLMWIGLSLLPTLTNSGRKVLLYATGGERIVAWWSSAALAVQVAVGPLLILRLGSTGAAMSVLISEAAIWWPLRRAMSGSARDRRQWLWTRSL
jgi:O-antigen/teichoic acid export membrane protein